MRTKFLSLQVKCVLAAAAGLVGCNAILDNQEGHLVASEAGGAAGRSSVGGRSGTPGGSATVGGATNGGSKSSVGGNTSVGGTATTQGGTKAAGGVTNVGGAQGTGGATPLGGSTSTSTSNTNAVGGVTNVGGNPPTGGAKATGGVSAGTSVTGGTSTIGTIAIGGAPVTGGRSGTGGTSANGGAPLTGGTKSTGGAPAGTGGTAPATGGVAPTGGAKSTGGAPATGGAATGGTSAIAGPSVVFIVATVNEGASTSLTTATFGFGSNPAGAASSYLCKFNAATTFTDCTGGLSLSQLSAGGQTLTVHALNSQGIAGPDATRSWSVAPQTTTIKNIRTLGTLTDNLVTVTTNVRVTGFGSQGGQQVIFVQEAGPAASLVVDAPSDIAGSPVLNAGILTRALTTQTARAEGAPVTVTGTVSMNGQSLELARSSYIWGTGAVIAYNIPEVRTSTVYASTLEGVRIGLAAQIPSFNCSSSCFNPQIGNSNLCIETTCMDTGCGTNMILAWLDITGGTVAPVTSGYGIWNGWLVKRSSYYELWTDSSAGGYTNDLCI